jgi:hypothetical protein
MHTPRFTTWLVLGLAVALAYVVRRGRRAPWRRAAPFDSTIDRAFAHTAGVPTEQEPASSPPAEAYAVPIAGADVDLDQLASVIDGAAGMHIEVLRPPGIPAWDATGDAAPLDPGMLPDEAEVADIYGDPRAPLGSGELYDVHLATAIDRELPDEDRAEDEGENWLEHLEASTAELGPEPERLVDPIDESELHAGHRRTDRRDTPVADLGSGGPRGL